VDLLRITNQVCRYTAQKRLDSLFTAVVGLKFMEERGSSRLGDRNVYIEHMLYAFPVI